MHSAACKLYHWKDTGLRNSAYQNNVLWKIEQSVASLWIIWDPQHWEQCQVHNWPSQCMRRNNILRSHVSVTVREHCLNFSRIWPVGQRVHDRKYKKSKIMKIGLTYDQQIRGTGLVYQKITLHVAYKSIRESVDSLCREGADVQYMQYLSKSRITSP